MLPCFYKNKNKQKKINVNFWNTKLRFAKQEKNVPFPHNSGGRWLPEKQKVFGKISVGERNILLKLPCWQTNFECDSFAESVRRLITVSLWHRTLTQPQQRVMGGKGENSPVESWELYFSLCNWVNNTRIWCYDTVRTAAILHHTAWFIWTEKQILQTNLLSVHLHILGLQHDPHIHIKKCILMWESLLNRTV